MTVYFKHPELDLRITLCGRRVNFNRRILALTDEREIAEMRAVIANPPHTSLRGIVELTEEEARKLLTMPRHEVAIKNAVTSRSMAQMPKDAVVIEQPREASVLPPPATEADVAAFANASTNTNIPVAAFGSLASLITKKPGE